MTAYKPKQIAIGFLMRDHGFTHAEALKELDFLFVNDESLFVKDHYLTFRRLGGRPLGNRSVRLSVYMSAQNAINHSA